MSTVLSIIVPVYNVEEYLRQTLDSILGQVTPPSMQILLINDGSTDSSPSICEEYAQRDSRIQVIHKENGGLSSARNVGLDHATGDYIAFLDSDDWLEPQAMKVCSDHLDHNPEVDVVGLGIIEQFSDGKAVNYAPDQLICLDNQGVLNELCFGFSFICGPTVWSKVFRKKVVENIRFNEGRSFEDNTFVFEAMYQVKQYHILPMGLINYRRGRPGALSRLSANMVDLFFNIEDALNKKPRDNNWTLYLNTMAVHYAWLYFYQTYREPKVYREFTERAMKFVRLMRRRPYLTDSYSVMLRIKLKLFLTFPRVYTYLSLRRPSAPRR